MRLIVAGIGVGSTSATAVSAFTKEASAQTKIKRHDSTNQRERAPRKARWSPVCSYFAIHGKVGEQRGSDLLVINTFLRLLDDIILDFEKIAFVDGDGNLIDR